MFSARQQGTNRHRVDPLVNKISTKRTESKKKKKLFFLYCEYFQNVIFNGLFIWYSYWIEEAKIKLPLHALTNMALACVCVVKIQKKKKKIKNDLYYYLVIKITKKKKKKRQSPGPIWPNADGSPPTPN